MSKFGDIASGGGQFFKPAEFASAAALMIEVTDFERQLPTNYGPKDTVTATIHAFGSAADVAADRVAISEDMKIQQVDLARKLSPLVGGATVVRLEKLEPTAKLPNGAWVWRSVEPELKSAVIAYDQRREAAAGDDDEMPDFS